ncbi:hypothetical protein BX661DRAFT_74947 [Kickxella alabastrina]|uniref:uncharacterized protein n=1 Tax=Kickxella alabastrina TaxID=61397 RepID=UPI00221F3F31|nr:uncharacterized protein BX661DRAFT_74947 [Kickxella alabastrina]KAI7833429.1 hypothetical protein BX661DRAFT_74947 [Kickxella alabastrina]
MADVLSGSTSNGETNDSIQSSAVSEIDTKNSNTGGNGNTSIVSAGPVSIPNSDSKANTNSNSDSKNTADNVTTAKPSASPSSNGGFGISLNNDGNNDGQDSSSPSKTSSDTKSTSGTSSGSSNGQPGRIVIKTPPQSVQSPLFEINSEVKLKWDYDNNMKKPPSQITIRGQMPPGYFQPGTSKPLYWYIAQNVSTPNKEYTWNTITESPPGYTLREGTGYKLFIYDSDIGWDNSTRVYSGKLFQFMLPFSMYNSRYAQSNDGVAKNYNPNAATRSVSVAPSAWTALLVAVLAAFAL